MKRNNNIRNIAIIAHVDHGKTTLVDALFKQSGVFREGKEVDDRVMDSGDLERERGITITAKNCSIIWEDTKINILDTPGHADFGGEVERALMMVDGAVLLVDAAEGPLPQSRFVLQKALEQNLKIIVCINKVDRADARSKEVLEEIYELFFDLEANDEQIDFPVLYAIGKNGVASKDENNLGDSLKPLFAQILETIPGPECELDKAFQMLVANLGFSDYLGQLAIGKVMSGIAKPNQSLVRYGRDNKVDTLRAVKLQSYKGVEIKEINEAEAGDIILLAGIANVEIGDTIAAAEGTEPLPRITVEEPTIGMRFAANNSPFSGREGDLVQGQKIYDRLKKETLYNVALKVETTDSNDAFLVKGRGEFQLAILIETMRREGFELMVGRPEILYKEEGGKKLEPIERVFIDCEEAFVGNITESLSKRKGRMVNMTNHGTGRVRVEFSIPSRGLIGYRNQFLSETKGTGIMSSYLESYEEYRGDFPSRSSGSLVSDRQGDAIAYSLFNLESRGSLFVVPGEPVYEGMIIGETNRDRDLNVNPCKGKKLTNVRAAGKDENVQLTPVTPLTIERAIDFIREDELVEVTPKNIRLRKLELNPNKRKDRL